MTFHIFRKDFLITYVVFKHVLLFKEEKLKKYGVRRDGSSSSACCFIAENPKHKIEIAKDFKEVMFYNGL